MCGSFACMPYVHRTKVILVQAENEFSEGTDHSPYMQNVIDTFRENGVVVRELS